MHDHCKHHHTRFRVYQKRLNLSEPEFIYIAALMFWSVGESFLVEVSRLHQ